MHLIHSVQLLVKKSFSLDLFQEKQTSAYIVIMEKYLVNWSFLCYVVFCIIFFTSRFNCVVFFTFGHIVVCDILIFGWDS